MQGLEPVFHRTVSWLFATHQCLLTYEWHFHLEVQNWVWWEDCAILSPGRCLSLKKLENPFCLVLVGAQQLDCCLCCHLVLLFFCWEKLWGKAGLSDSYLLYISRVSVSHHLPCKAGTVTELADRTSIPGIAATLGQVWVSVMFSHKRQPGEATPGKVHTDGECGWLKGSYSCLEQLLYPCDSVC